MFDPVTAALIRAAPPLDGLDLDDLPKRLTAAYANVVSARIRLRGSALATPDPELTKTLIELRRLAAAQEVYVALLPDRENRSAAAFVAASAHQACLLAAAASPQSRITSKAIAPELSSALLFLVADANADAAEAAKRIVADLDHSTQIEYSLLLAIKNLAQGRLGAIVREEVPTLVDVDEDATDLATQALLLLLLKGVQALALQLRRRNDHPLEEGGVEPAAAIFKRVKALCVEPIEDTLAFNLYPGPLHLANLLLAVERDLLGSALARVPTPGGTPEDGWWTVIRRMSRRRPYLWRNHREAIARGYLEPGISSAISFPTGGGKSTLAELKIATTLLRGEKAVFLAPTHALVGQTTKALQDTFEAFAILADIEDEITIDDVIVLPEVTVTTPERCLMLLSIQPEAFSDLGLIVFDECHLLHPRQEDRSRRAIDAMLAVLNLSQIAPKADFLFLSAMMKNTAEIAGWLKSLTGRNCLALDLSWKPTRQVRGCVVYSSEEIKLLKVKLNQARVDRPAQKSVPAKIKRELLASPYGLFSLLQTWSTNDRQDYTLLPMLSARQQLSTGNRKNGDWYLTPNGNEVSGAVAAASASARMKTLVFVQTTVFCESCVNNFRARVPPRPVTLSEQEAKLHAFTVEEMGGKEYCYLSLDDDDNLRTGAASHHSLLLRQERDLHESLFKRRDGIDVLFATSTLAQGMNLPSEVVIISGDSRFDANADKMQKMEAHELLNAAGRAGRAGEGAQGFVLLVPSKVIDFDDENSQIHAHWSELQSIFEQADQCLTIEDPLSSLLDQIHASTIQVGTPAYLLSKLPLSVSASEEDPAAVLLKRSFAVYQARAAGNENWIESRISSALAARAARSSTDETQWLEQVAASTGLSVALLQELVELIDSGKLGNSVGKAIASLMGWLENTPPFLLRIVRAESLEGLLGTSYKELPDDEQRAALALPAIKKLLPLWMAGAPLCALEKAHLERPDNLGRCEYARHFALRIVPDLAFLATLPSRLVIARKKRLGDTTPLQTVIATLGAIVREGCDSPEALAVRINCGREVSRVEARRRFEEIKVFAAKGADVEDFDQTRQRMRDADTFFELTRTAN